MSRERIATRTSEDPRTAKNHAETWNPPAFEDSDLTTSNIPSRYRLSILSGRDWTVSFAQVLDSRVLLEELPAALMRNDPGEVRCLLGLPGVLTPVQYAVNPRNEPIPVPKWVFMSSLSSAALESNPEPEHDALENFIKDLLGQGRMLYSDFLAELDRKNLGAPCMHIYSIVVFTWLGLIRFTTHERKLYVQGDNPPLPDETWRYDDRAQLMFGLTVVDPERQINALERAMFAARASLQWGKDVSPEELKDVESGLLGLMEDTNFNAHLARMHEWLDRDDDIDMECAEVIDTGEHTDAIQFYRDIEDVPEIRLPPSAVTGSPPDVRYLRRYLL